MHSTLEGLTDNELYMYELMLKITYPIYKDENVKSALNFALLEDFDHLYRFSNLLLMDYGIKAENLVGKYTEITPGRPTISEHRHPYDSIRYAMNTIYRLI